MSTFNVKNYINEVVAVKTAEQAFIAAKEKAGQKHVDFVAYIGTVSSREELLNRALAELQKADKAWLPEVGYQKADKAGIAGATCYNKFQAWTYTNVCKETGKLFSAEEKAEYMKSKKDKASATNQAKQDALIAEAQQGMIPADSVKPLTIGACIDFLQSNGFKMAIKGDKITLTGAMPE